LTYRRLCQDQAEECRCEPKEAPPLPALTTSPLPKPSLLENFSNIGQTLVTSDSNEYSGRKLSLASFAPVVPASLLLSHDLPLAFRHPATKHHTKSKLQLKILLSLLRNWTLSIFRRGRGRGYAASSDGNRCVIMGQRSQSGGPNLGAAF